MVISDVKLRDAEKKLYVLTIANNDLFAANTALDLITKLKIKNKSDARYTPLMHAFVICYARPFKKSQGYQPLPNTFWPGYTSPRQQALHDTVITLRDKIVAHSDAEFRSTTIYPPGTAIPGVDSKEFNWRVVTSNENLSLNDIPTIKSMCKDILGRINAERTRIFHEAFLDKKTPFKLNP